MSWSKVPAKRSDYIMSEETKKLTRAEFDNQVGSLMQAFIRGGGRPEDAREVLEHHADGTEYVAETLGRVAQQQYAAQQERKADIEEDNITVEE
jgi:hypothetical protein